MKPSMSELRKLLEKQGLIPAGYEVGFDVEIYGYLHPETKEKIYLKLIKA